MFSVRLLATANEQIRPLDHRTEQETWAILAHLRYRSTNLQSCASLAQTAIFNQTSAWSCWH